MKLVLAALLLIMVVGTHAQWHQAPGQAIRGAGDMLRAYSDMREANYKNSDKYFHARGNYDAAQRGPGGKWAAEVISNGREWLQGLTRHGNQDAAADQEANRWGRDGNDPNKYRPEGLPDKY